MRFFLILLSTFLTFNFGLKAQSSEDESAVRGLVENMVTGWNNGSGETYSSSFADEHVYIVWDGQYYAHSSRDENARAHDGLYASRYKDTRLHATIDKLTFIRPDVAILHVLAAVDKAEMPRPEHPAVIFSAVATKEDNEWQIAFFHNSNLEMFERADPEASSPMPISLMFGSWYATER